MASELNNLGFYEPLLPVNHARIEQHHPLYHRRDDESLDDYARRSAQELEDKIFEIGVDKVSAFIGETMLSAMVGDVPPANLVRVLAAAVRVAREARGEARGLGVGPDVERQHVAQHDVARHIVHEHRHPRLAAGPRPERRRPKIEPGERRANRIRRRRLLEALRGEVDAAAEQRLAGVCEQVQICSFTWNSFTVNLWQKQPGLEHSP